MKLVLIILICLFNQLSSQKCGCSTNIALKSLISCKPTTFQNGAKIYWEFDCNSSWITFQNGKVKKKLFELEKDYIEFSGRLGFTNWTEYKNSILIENSTVSGCCQPGEFILFDKNDGEKINDLGTIVYVDNSDNLPFAITYKSNEELLFTSLNSNKSCSIKISKRLIEKTLKNSAEFYPENLFNNISLKNGLLQIEFKYKESKNSPWKKNLIQYNTKKYCS